MAKYYVLKQAGVGAIAYNKDSTIIESMYEEETQQGRFSGFSVKEVEIPQEMFNLNITDFWTQLTRIS